MKRLLLTLSLVIASKAHQVLGPNGITYGKVDLHTGGEDGDRMIESKEKPDILEINKDIKGLIHGDVIPRKTTRNTMTDANSQWPTTTIPFEYTNLASLESIGSIELARQEYKLRTCLNFVERKTEDNYIAFRTLDGCYSSIGMVGGEQTISIGIGCERMATVCHEMLHAIGFWHEQSRADRNDYVIIEWDNIQPGYESNFDSYDWDISSARRLPYDYNSIMHYWDNGFSIDGGPTITTRDPKFQKVIGQRLTFSRDDSTKINRMYNCSDTLLYSYNCNFEEESVCGYVQNYEDDDIDWLRYVIGDKTISTSPYLASVDATTDVSGVGSFMLLDNSGKTAGLVAEMRTMRLVSKSDVQCLQFSYYLDRESGSSASISAYIGYIDETTGNITSLSGPLVTFDQGYKNGWNVQRMTIQAPSAYKLVFRGQTGANSDDVVGLDDISVQDKPCETSYFIINNYREIIQNAVKGETFLYSPVMYNEEGYAYKVKIYPVGNSSAPDGYMSIYFGLVEGEHDDELTWPFCNKYVRLMVVDQNNNPLYALNKYNEFLTNQENGGDIWNKPQYGNQSAGYFGQTNFMKLADLENTHHYLKHDTLMVSVLITATCRQFVKPNGRVESGYLGSSFLRGRLPFVNYGLCVSTRTPYALSALRTIALTDSNDGCTESPVFRSQDMNWVRGDVCNGSFSRNDAVSRSVSEDGFDDDDDDEDDDDYHEEKGDDVDDVIEDTSEEEEGKISLGVTIGIAVGCGAVVLVIMTGILLYVNEAYRRNLRQATINNVTMHANTEFPPAYSTAVGNAGFDPAPEKV